jgi:predicted GIY-YIG superfamily endonuclease
MYYVYVLRSQIDNGLYIGFTQHLEARVNKHNAGKNLATNPRKPFEFIFYEAYQNKYDALRRKRYFKSGKGRISRNLMLKEGNQSSN